MEQEDLRIEQAEDREWERLRDTVEAAQWDIDSESCRDHTPHVAHGVCPGVDEDDEDEDMMDRDEPRFQFIDEK